MSQTVYPGPAGLAAQGITVAYRDRVVIKDLDVQVAANKLTGIVGPNGCGKSTLLKAMSRLTPLSAGTIEIGGSPLTSYSSRKLAQKLAVLPQNPVAPEGILVADLVALGRHPHQSWARQWSQRDSALITEALQRTDVADLADRRVSDLSGGQRQRVWVAMVLAQAADILLLDEPTTFLDLARSLELLDLIDTLHDERGRTVVMVLHDLGLACRYCDELIVMKEGAVVAQGAPADIISEEMLWEVFGLRSKVIDDPVSSQPLVVPVGSRRIAESVNGTAPGSTR